MKCPIRCDRIKMDEVGGENKIKKIVLVGNSGIGKTRAVRQLMKIYTHTNRYTPTIGIDLRMLTNRPEGRIAIWDIGGDDRYYGMGGDYYKNSDLIIICGCTAASEDGLKWKRRVEKCDDLGETEIIYTSKINGKILASFLCKCF